MVEHLSTLIENFPGAANQTQCFSHILNLVAKSILRQFEVQKKTGRNKNLEDENDALAALAQELEVEDGGDLPPDDQEGEAEGDDGDDEVEDDDEDGLVDECDGMSEEEVTELEDSIVPVRLMLTKVTT